MNHLYNKNIFPGVHYVCNTEYPMYKYGKGSCPNAERISNNILSLPIHMNLSDIDLEYVSTNVKTALNKV